MLWDARLFDAIRAQVAAGLPTLYRNATIRADSAIIRADADGAVVLKSQGGKVTWTWARMVRSDRRLGSVSLISGQKR
jgi:hypothetical protein